MKKILIILFCSLLGFNAYSQDWKARLKEEMVTIANNQYTVKEYQLMKFKNGASLQMKITANGPTAVMSRDFFLSTYSTLSLFTMFGILEEIGMTLDDVEFEEVDEADAKPDFTLDFNMMSTGLIMSVISKEDTDKTEMTWEEFFADN